MTNISITYKGSLVAETPPFAKVLLPAVYYIYGGMKQRFAQKTKTHICDDNGKVLCGVKSHWMEAGEPIDENGFEKGWEHLFSLFDERSCTCKRCLKEWCRLNGR